MKEQTPKQKKGGRSVISTVLFIISLLCFLGSAGYLARYYFISHRAESHVSSLKDLMDVEEEVWEETEIIDLGGGETKSEKVSFNPKFKKLYKENSDIVGWIKIDDTTIDYPVMQTMDDNEFYLHKNFQKEEEFSGLPFVDNRCDVKKPSENLIIYGHHMNTDTMFTDVHEYKDKKFYDKHQIIHFDTIYGDGDYEIVYVILSKAYGDDEKVFKYYDFIECEDEKEFEETKKALEGLSMYDTGKTITREDDLITLSTCEYSQTNGRMALIAKKIDR